jgi:hypothetical protein
MLRDQLCACELDRVSLSVPERQGVGAKALRASNGKRGCRVETPAQEHNGFLCIVHADRTSYRTEAVSIQHGGATMKGDDKKNRAAETGFSGGP